MGSESDAPRALTAQEVTEIVSCLTASRKKRKTSFYEQSRLDIVIDRLKGDLEEIRIRPSQIKTFSQEIERQFHSTHVSPGEMVGITCAQSIGERQTQMSVAADHGVWIRRRTREGRRYLWDHIGTLGGYIDRVMEEEASLVEPAEGGGDVMPTRTTPWVDEILAVDRRGVVRWSPIREYSRHPPNGSLQRILTASGRTVDTTLSHSLLTTTDRLGTVTHRSPIIPIVASRVVVDQTPVPRLKDRLVPTASPKTLSSKISRTPPATIGTILSVWTALCQTRQAIETRPRAHPDEKIVEEAIYLLGDLVLRPDGVQRLCKRLRHPTHSEWSAWYRTTAQKRFLQMLCVVLELSGIPHTSRWRPAEGMVTTLGTFVLGFDDEHRPMTRDESWDRIVRILPIPESEYLEKYRYVYDLSVESETFFLLDGIFVHNTLNTFHSAGLAVQTVLSGVPRFMELLNATKEPKYSSTRFRLVSEGGAATTIHAIRTMIRDRIVHLTMNDVIRTVDILTAPTEELWHGPFESIYSDRFHDGDRCIRIQFNVDTLYQYHIRLDRLAQHLETRFEDIVCVFSPQHLGQMDIYVDTSLLDAPANDRETPVVGYTIHDGHEGYFLESVFLPRLREEKICGIPGIKEYVVNKEGPEYWVVTNGNNFSALLGIPWIDRTTICSNNMWDIYTVMGIEATRQFLIDEFQRVISSDGTFIHPSHVTLLVDIMTHQGIIVSISRYGMKKEQTSPLAKASFEECLDHFLTAGFIGDEEPIEGVSASIICGKRSKIGTGLCHLQFDPGNIIKSSVK